MVVSGVGVISALGRDRRAFWESLRSGRSGIGPIEMVATDGLQFKNGAEVRDFDVRDSFDKKSADLLDRFAQFLVVAAREAVADAGVVWDDSLKRSTAVVSGSCLGGKNTENVGFASLYRDKRTRLPATTIPRIMANAGASHVSSELGITGPVFTLSTACSSSSHAIGMAYWMVRQGMAEAALAGGSEAPFSWGHLKAWEAIRAVAPDTCRPFSRNRRGLILGEGGAMLFLEPMETAIARGATIYAEFVGFGMSSDAGHVTNPSSTGATLAIQRALSDSGIGPESVGYVNAHGTGTIVNDPAEVRAIRQAFGPHADRLAVSSTKSMHGHGLGAAGAIEAAATVLALRHGELPPTTNFVEPDPACDLDVVPNESRKVEVDFALSNSLAFGGLNVVLAFARWSPSRGTLDAPERSRYSHGRKTTGESGSSVSRRRFAGIRRRTDGSRFAFRHQAGAGGFLRHRRVVGTVPQLRGRSNDLSERRRRVGGRDTSLG